MIQQQEQQQQSKVYSKSEKQQIAKEAFDYGKGGFLKIGIKYNIPWTQVRGWVLTYFHNAKGKARKAHIQGKIVEPSINSSIQVESIISGLFNRLISAIKEHDTLITENAELLEFKKLYIDLTKEYAKVTEERDRVIKIHNDSVGKILSVAELKKLAGM